MANITIPNLPSAIALTGSEQVEVVQSNTSVRTTTQAIANLATINVSAITSLTVNSPLYATGGNPITSTGSIGLNSSSVTNTYLGTMPTLTLKGNNTGSTAAPTDLSVASVMTMLGAAPLASPTFTGTPRAPTPATSDNSTQIATTAFVKAQAIPSSFTRTTITASGGQTTFSVSYSVGSIQVYLNGVMLAPSDYTATSGTSVVLGLAAAAGDIFDAFSFAPQNTTGIVPVVNGGSGTSSLSGYVYGNGTSPFTASTTIPATALSGILAAANGGTGVASTSLMPVTATGSTTARTLAAMQGDVVNVLNWGADPTGAAECSSAIQAAINYAAAQGSGFPSAQGNMVFFPAGTYLIGSTLTLASGVVLSGEGVWNTVLKATSTFSNIMISAISTSAVTTINQAGVENLSIFGNGQLTTGVQFQNNNRSFVRDCRFFAHNYGFAGADNWQVALSNVWMGEAATGQQNNTGFYFFWDGVKSYNPNLNNAYICQNCNVQATLINGFRAENAQGSIFTDCQAVGTSQHGWYFGDCPNVGGAYANLQFIFMDNCQSDTESDYGFMFSRGNAPVCTGIVLTNIWAGLQISANKANIYLNGVSDLVLNGFNVASSSYALLAVNSNNLIISNGRCFNYDFYNTGAGGIVLQSCLNSQVIGCNVTPYSGVSSPGAGVIETGTSDNNLVANNFLQKGYTLIGSKTIARDNMGSVGSLASQGSYLIGQSTNPDNATVAINQQAGGGNVGIETNASISTIAYHMLFRNSNGQVGSISTSGSSTTFGTSSDYRLKENVTPLTNALARTTQIPVYRFNWKSNPGGAQVDGFLAHELAEHIPEAVVGEKDAVKADGGIAPQAVDQSKLVPLLVAAVQELSAEISALKIKVGS